MANELIKMKTGTIANLDQVALDRGAIYFAIDTSNLNGKIVYDAPVGESNAARIAMNTLVKGEAENSYRLGQVNLTPANLGISATTTSVTVGNITFNQYVHPTVTAIMPAAVKVGNDALGHTVLGDALTPSDIGALPISGGTLTGALTLHADPTNNLHAATKQYVDNLVINDLISNEVLSFSIGRNTPSSI